MWSCSSAHCVLILLTAAVTAGSEADPAVVKVKLHESATLPCSERCSGLVRWTVKHDPFHVLAQCNRTSCQWKEGFKVSHHQYLKGNFSLNVTDVDLKKRTTYTCQCDDKTICTVTIQIETSIGSTVRVKRHQSAILPYSDNFTGVVTWIMDRNLKDTVAWCNQTTCQSIKAGYQMSYDQYLKGNFSLTITDADYSKMYACQCDNMPIYEVFLQIEPFSSSVRIKPNDSLVLDLDITDPVTVIYNNTDASRPSGQICTVDGRSTQCGPEYTQRVSLALELRGMKVSDSGVYIIQNTSNKEFIHIYTVTVQDDQPQPDVCRDVVLVWVVALLSVLVIVLLVVLLITCVRKRGPNGEYECLQFCTARSSGEDSLSTEEVEHLPSDHS